MFPTTYGQAKTASEAMFAECIALGKIMEDIVRGSGMKRDAMGLTPDVVRATTEWKIARKDYDTAWAKMGKFNQWFSRTFKAEIRADRDAKRVARLSERSNENLLTQIR